MTTKSEALLSVRATSIRAFLGTISAQPQPPHSAQHNQQSWQQRSLSRSLALTLARSVSRSRKENLHLNQYAGPSQEIDKGLSDLFDIHMNQVTISIITISSESTAGTCTTGACTNTGFCYVCMSAIHCHMQQSHGGKAIPAHMQSEQLFLSSKRFYET